MRAFTFTTTTVAALAAVALASHDAGVSRRHHELVHRAPQPAPAPEPRTFTSAIFAPNASEPHSLEKRGFSNARGTWYDVGLGACGKHNVPGDFIVALNSAQYGGGYPGPNCFKKIKITYKGISGIATIMDECPGCPYAGLDFSKGLFTHFSPLSAGVIYVNWEFVDGNDDEPAPKPKPKPTPTKTPEQKPTPKPKPKPEPSSTSHKTTSTSHSTTHKSTSSTKDHPSSTSHSSTPTPTQTPTGPQNVQALEDAFLGMAGLLQVAMDVNGSVDVGGDDSDGSDGTDGSDGADDGTDDGSDAQ